MIIEKTLPRKYNPLQVKEILEQEGIKILEEIGGFYFKLEGTAQQFQDAKTAILALNTLEDIDV